jgi:hypothetical protein
MNNKLTEMIHAKTYQHHREKKNKDRLNFWLSFIMNNERERFF